jgi:hypothetical protein
MAKVNQKQILVNHLRGTGLTLTPAQAKAKFGIKNLAARMSELREAGLIVNVENSAYRISARDVLGSRAKFAL